MESSSLVQQIRAAFPPLPLPEMSLHQAQLTDQSMSREITRAEWAAAGARDAGRTWDGLLPVSMTPC